MFQQQNSPSSPEPNGIEIKIKLSEDTLIKCLPFVTALVMGSGWLAHSQLSNAFPAVPNNVEIEVLE